MHAQLRAANQPQDSISQGEVMHLPSRAPVSQTGNPLRWSAPASSTQASLLFALEADAARYAKEGQPLLSRVFRDAAREVRAEMLRERRERVGEILWRLFNPESA